MSKLLLNINFLLELGPLIVFLITYKLSNILLATTYIMIATVVCITLRYMITKNISLQLLLSGGALLALGSLTLITGNTRYVKMKPTVMYTIFALIVFIGKIFNKFFIKDVFNKDIQLIEEHWKILSNRVVYYFCCLAVSNEIIWRCFSENFWVNFKIFGVGSASMIFAITQLRFITKSQIKDDTL